MSGVFDKSVLGFTTQIKREADKRPDSVCGAFQYAYNIKIDTEDMVRLSGEHFFG